MTRDRVTIEAIVGDITRADAERWTEQAVVDRLDAFVLRRHRIAHSGDVATNRKAATPIRLDYVREAERVIRAVGLAVCDVVDERLAQLRRM